MNPLNITCDEAKELDDNKLLDLFNELMYLSEQIEHDKDINNISPHEYISVMSDVDKALNIINDEFDHRNES